MVPQARDYRLLRELAEVLRVADREQASTVAGFRSVTRANERLLALTRTGLLNRCFVGTLNGGKKSLYMLTAKGAGLVGLPNTGLRRKRDSVLVRDAFIDHQLRINQLYLQIKYRSLPAGITFESWRVFTQPLSPSAPIVPDGYAELATPDKRICMFMEVDLGSERLDVWRKKTEAYLRFAVSDDFERFSGRTHFRVAVVANSERRMRFIRQVVSLATDKMFWLTSFDSIERNGIWSAIWLRPGNGNADSVSLLGEPL